MWGCGCSPDMRMEIGLSAVSFEMAGRPYFFERCSFGLKDNVSFARIET